MSKRAEIAYFADMSEEGQRFVRGKPFTADERGAYLIDIGQILSLIPGPPGQLIDIGCGSGWTTGMFAQSGYESLGVDIAPDAIRCAREAFGHTGATYEIHDFEQLPFVERFNVAVVYDCLHHADDPVAVIGSIHRVLRKGGEIILVEPGRNHQRSPAAQWAVQTFGVTENDMPPRLTTRLLRNAGFQSIRVFPRARLQAMERVGTGGIVARLAPIFGSRFASAVKTMKHTFFCGDSGVVLAKKPS